MWCFTCRQKMVFLLYHPTIASSEDSSCLARVPKNIQSSQYGGESGRGQSKKYQADREDRVDRKNAIHAAYAKEVLKMFLEHDLYDTATYKKRFTRALFIKFHQVW